MMLKPQPSSRSSIPSSSSSCDHLSSSPPFLSLSLSLSSSAHHRAALHNWMAPWPRGSDGWRHTQRHTDRHTHRHTHTHTFPVVCCCFSSGGKQPWRSREKFKNKIENSWTKTTSLCVYRCAISDSRC